MKAAEDRRAADGATVMLLEAEGGGVFVDADVGAVTDRKGRVGAVEETAAGGGQFGFCYAELVGC